MLVQRQSLLDRLEKRKLKKEGEKANKEPQPELEL
jgi:hypothetical protein